MVPLTLVISLVCLPYLTPVGSSYSPISGDCLRSKGPRFSPSPRWPDSPATAGGSSQLVFTCTVNTTLTPSFNVTWIKDGEVIKPSDHALFEMDDQVLKIWPLMDTDGGNYTCTITDNEGLTCSYSGFETVVPYDPENAPVIVATSPVNGVKVVSLGDSTQIGCTMTDGSSGMLFTQRIWTRNGSELDDTSHYYWDSLDHPDGRKELVLNITNVTSEDLGEYTCVAKNNFGRDNKTITLQQFQPGTGFKLTTWQIAVIAVGGFVTIAMATVAIVIIRIRRKKEHIEWPPLDPEKYDVPGYRLEYDVFISYSSEDEEWVKNKLFKELLSMGYNINIDFKDFVPGMAIAENVIDSIYKSRKTIVLMSKNFLRSMWGQFELQQAHNKAIAQRKDVLILIKYDKCKVPGKLMGKTFLDWTDETIQPHFWQRLKDAIGDPVNYTEINQLPVAEDQLPVTDDQLPVVGDQLPVAGDQLPVRKQDDKNSEENKVEKDNQNNKKKDVDNVQMRQKKKRQKMDESEGMNEEELEGIRISQEEKMQLII